MISTSESEPAFGMMSTSQEVGSTSQEDGIRLETIRKPVVALQSGSLDSGNLSTLQLSETADLKTVNDSGYGPSARSTTTASGESSSGIRRRCLFEIPGHPNYFLFDMLLDPKVQSHAKDVARLIERQILLHQQNRRPMTTIRPMPLGPNEDDVALYVVVFCDIKLHDAIKNVVDNELIKSACDSSNGRMKIKTTVIPKGPRRRHALSNIKFYRNNTTTNCGASLLLVNDAAGPSRGHSRKATVGGTIKVKGSKGETKLYGMIAAHTIEDWWSTIQDSDKCTVSNSANTESCGHILNLKTRNGRAYEHTLPTRDWMLLSFKKDKINELCMAEYPGYYKRCTLLSASQPSILDGSSDPVVMISPSGPKRGEISNLTSRVFTGYGETFVDAYILTLNEDEVCDGDSGAWVVHNSSSEVYGHVIATDVSGDAYIIPLIDTLEEIRDFLGAQKVELPNEDDFHLEPPTHSGSDSGLEDSECTHVTRVKTSEAIKSSIRQRKPFSQPKKKSDSDNVGSSNSFEHAGMIYRHHDIPRNTCHFDSMESDWFSEFSVLRSIHNGRTIVDIKSEIDADGDHLEIFFSDYLQPYGDADSRSGFESVKKLCKGVTLNDVISGRGRIGSWKSAWLDQRTCGCLQESGNMPTGRHHRNPLSAAGLYESLIHEPNAARQLVYVADLSPGCVYALAVTASAHHAPALRKAIYKHLGFECEIGINFPSTGFLTFELSLHLAFFLIRQTPPDEDEGEVKIKPERQWRDLSFLDGDSLSLPDHEQQRWGIYEAHISFVVAGLDNWRWRAYGFVDSEIDDLLHESSEMDLEFDQIARGRLEASNPIWDPRDYWLTVVQIRSEQVSEEWRYLINRIESCVDKYTSRHSFTIAGCSGSVREKDEEIKKAFDWTVRTVVLVNQLDCVLSNTVQAWQSFSGDMNYFRDVSSNACRSLRLIKAAYDQLHGIQKKLNRIKNTCAVYKGTLQLRLTVDSKQAADGYITSSHLTFLILCPIALAASIFSMQPAAIPFVPTPRSFAITAFILVLAISIVRLVMLHGPMGWLVIRRLFAACGRLPKLTKEIDGGSFELPQYNASSRAIVDEEMALGPNSLNANQSRIADRLPESQGREVAG